MTNGRKVKSRKLKSVDGHEVLIEAAKESRQETRDHLLMLLMYRHGLRITEVLRLRVKDIEGGLSTEHPLAKDELRFLKAHLRDRTSKLPWLFVSEHDRCGHRGSLWGRVFARKSSSKGDPRNKARVKSNFGVWDNSAISLYFALLRLHPKAQ